MKTRKISYTVKTSGLLFASLMCTNATASDEAIKIGVPSWSAGEN